MPELIFDGDRLAAAILRDADIERVAIAVRFYTERVTWTPTDTEREDYKRILRDLTTKAPA